MGGKGSNPKSFLKDYKFLATCSNGRKRKAYLSHCANLDSLIGNIQNTCGKLARITKSLSNSQGKKILKNHKALGKVHKNRNLARRQTLTGANVLKDVFKLIAKNPEILTIPLSFL